MKFSNGNWLNKEGYTLEHPMELYDVEKKERSLTVYAPFTPIIHRGKTLDGGMMTVELSSPLEDVICVKLSHHSGGMAKGHILSFKKKMCLSILKKVMKNFSSRAEIFTRLSIRKVNGNLIFIMKKSN